VATKRWGIVAVACLLLASACGARVDPLLQSGSNAVSAGNPQSAATNDTVTTLAEQAGLKLDRGITVNEFLETSVPGIYAAGDIARWPDPRSKAALRVEHWVVATRQGQTAARNMLGMAEEFTAVPFFWSQHYDMSINYVGHAESWNELVVEGDLMAKDGLVRFRQGGDTLAVASLFRDLDSLKAEVAMEQRA
jgi:hypothetical protein